MNHEYASGSVAIRVFVGAFVEGVFRRTRDLLL
jgi:hypothetical protein